MSKSDSWKDEFSNCSISIRKRTNQWNDGIVKRKCNAKIRKAKATGDRFIPRRWTAANNEKNLKFFEKNTPRDIFLLSTNYWRHNAFKSALNNVMELENERILQTTDREMLQNSAHKYISNQDWPCVPRIKPSVFPERTYDMSQGSIMPEECVTDLSCDGQIAVTSGIDIIIYRTKENVATILEKKFPSYLAYSRSGKYLAAGCETSNCPILEIWDVQAREFIMINCKRFDRRHFYIQCIEWNFNGSKIICGTWLGTIFILNAEDLNVLCNVRRHTAPITGLRFSPTMRYLASADAKGVILIHKWPNVDDECLQVDQKTATVFDWHPWTGEDLVFAEQNPPSIMLYNVRQQTVEAYYKKMDKNIIINAISFSKLTGELLVSISKDGDVVQRSSKMKHSTFYKLVVDDRFKDTCEVLVLSALDCVVDVIRQPYGNTKFLAWSPDGTYVVTSGKDDTTVILWNFCSKAKCTRNTQEKPIPKFGCTFKRWNNMR